MPLKTKAAEDYIQPLIMNGLHGRMLRMPAPSKKRSREILFVYGHHASLERQFGLVEIMNQYGAVTVPDLPGFGGMQSFYKIHEKPTIDNLADYLASFVKLRYKRKKVTIIAMSLGFAITTRMLQRCPELTNKVELLVSLVGFVHKEDFHIRKRNTLLMRYGASIFSRRLSAGFVRYVALRPSLIRFTYHQVADKHSKLKDADEAERDKRIDFEIKLWHMNDVRTYMDTTVTMFTLDLCKERVNLDVYHVAVAHDRYFDNEVVEQHLGVIYNKVSVITSVMPNHGPTVVATAKDAAPFIPRRLRQLLAS